MANNLEENPFCALFGSIQDAENLKIVFKQEAQETSLMSGLPSYNAEPSLLEKLLLASTRDNIPNFTYVYMSDTPPLSLETVDVILFERILLDNLNENIRNRKQKPSFKEEKAEVVGRNEVIIYLFEVYERCWKYRESDCNILMHVQSSILNNLSTALEQPEIFSGQRLNKQLRDLIFDFISSSSSLADMLNRLLTRCSENKEIPLLSVFDEILVDVKRELDLCSLMKVDWNLIDIMDFYSSSPVLAPLLLQPKSKGLPGRQYQLSCVGVLLSISCLPKDIQTHSEFFNQPSTQGAQYHKMTENSIAIAQNALNNRIYNIFMSLLKVSPEVKDTFLKWIESCLEANSGRAGIWHIQSEEIRNLTFVSDGFMVNLGALLLKVASPFSAIEEDDKNLKILKVDPLYCSNIVSKNRSKIKGLYSGNLPKQTTLVPNEEAKESDDKNDDFPRQFSFTTTCFFQTHRALHLGVQVLHQKLFKMSQELGRLQHQYQEVSGHGSPATEMMRKHMEHKTSLFLSYKAAFQSSQVDDMLQFLAVTTIWLNQVALTPCNEQLSSTVRDISLSDLSAERTAQKSQLRFVPEFIVENLVEGIIAVRRYMAEAFSLSGEPLIRYYMSFIISFMGSPHWMNNPHLRAHLAECLETLMPNQKENVGLVSGVRDRIFVEHPLSPHLATAIIHVFVSIEMTGQSVAFEEKFNYRRPMYEIMKYLWNISDHRKQFVQLAEFALANMECSKPPLFLRFVNLLMNDAIFLLDEGLSYMAQIRESQTKKESGEWNKLPAEQRAENEQNLQQNGYLARFHNMLGSRTIQVLVRLTKDIPGMFTHPTLIERMSVMLNHFLAHLVGPKRRNLKVRDMEKYEFRPADIVGDICTIYIHLSKEREFSNAVCADDRSYSPELFNQACNVLARIGRYALKEDLESFSIKVNEACAKRTEDGDLAAIAPEEFLDPIMSQLMMDPVILPSSRMIVDRQTIARHLLSDQTDPFNRQPLTMEQIIGAEELKATIQDWLRERKAKVSDEKNN